MRKLTKHHKNKLLPNRQFTKLHIDMYYFWQFKTDLMDRPALPMQLLKMENTARIAALNEELDSVPEALQCGQAFQNQWWIDITNISINLNSMCHLTMPELTWTAWGLLMLHCCCLSRMEDQDGVSQASSSATVSFLPIRDKVNHMHTWTNIHDYISQTHWQESVRFYTCSVMKKSRRLERDVKRRRETPTVLWWSEDGCTRG